MPLPDQDKKLIEKLTQWLNDAEGDEGSRAARDRFSENLDYWSGIQYDAETAQRAEKEERGLITVNNIFKYLMMMSGVERQQRQDIRAFPVGLGSDPLVADLLSLAIKHIDYHTQAKYVRSDMYVHAQIADRSYIKWSLKFNKLFPIISMTAPDPRDVFEQPTAQTYSFEEGHKYVFERIWLTQDEIVKKYSSTENEKDEIIRHLNDKEFKDDRRFVKRTGKDEFVAIWECQYKEHTQVAWAWHPEPDERRPAIIKDLPVGEVAAAKEKGYNVIFDTEQEGHIVRFTGGLLLENLPHYLPNGQFNISRYSPYFAMGRDVSWLDQLKSQQDELNANRSSMRELIGRAPKGTVIYTDSSGLSDTDAENISVLGGVFKVADMEQIKVLDTSAYYSALTAFAQMYQLASKESQELSGITDVLQGNLKSSTSGVVFARAANQAAIGLQMGLDNYNRTLSTHYKKLIPIIQRFFPAQNVLRLSGDQYPFLTKALRKAEGPEGEGEGFVEYTPGEIRLLNEYREVIQKIDKDISLGTYDVVLDFSKSSINQQLQNTSLLTELLQSVPQLAPFVAHKVVAGMPIPDAQQIAEEMQAAQQAQAKRADQELQLKALEVAAKQNAAPATR